MPKKSAFIRLPGGSKIQERLTESKTPFTVFETSASKTIETEIDGQEKSFFLTDTPLTGKELSFLTATKKHIRGRNMPGTNWNPSNIAYFKFRNKPLGIHKNIVEIDINGAYWSAAFHLGYLAEDVFEAGKLQSKKARLITLGSLATRKRKSFFDGEKLNYISTDFDPTAASWFFHIAGFIGKIMSDFFSRYPGATYFYWVDAMFISTAFEQIFINYLAENGLECKMIKTDFLEIEENDRFFSYKISQNKIEKVFLRLKNERKREFLNDIKKIENGS